MLMKANGIRFTSAHTCPLLAVLMEIAAYSPSDLDVYPTVSNPAPPNHFPFPRSLHRCRNYRGLDFRANLLMVFHVSFYVYRYLVLRYLVILFTFDFLISSLFWLLAFESHAKLHL